MSDEMLVKGLSPAAGELSIKMINVSQGAMPADVIDAAVNVLGIHMMTFATMSGKSRGEAKAFFRKCCEVATKTAMVNFDKAKK